MGKRMMLTGNYACAYGVKLARAEVVPVYPITPQTHVMEKLVEFVSKGELDAEFVPVESEHSAMAVAIAAEATGARAFTATSAQGLVYMHENLFVASGMRLPIVMAIVNRALGAPNTIFPDWSDALDQRDTGWIQIFVENAQEAHDMIVQAYRIAEDERVYLPVAVCFEGIIISHCMEPVALMDQTIVDKFLPPYEPKHIRLHPDRVMSMGLVLMDDAYYMEYRYQQQEGMDNALKVIPEVDDDFGRTFGRKYGGLLQAEDMEDAELVLLTLGSLASTCRLVVKTLRKEGIKAGLVKLRTFRPFPNEELRSVLKNAKCVVVLERDVSIGAGGIVYLEVSNCLYMLKKRPLIINYIIGLGGREITLEDVMGIARDAYKEREQGTCVRPIRWFKVRGLI
jgi:pyruvate ferredoxin oxidoreductase alpha subunit